MKYKNDFENNVQYIALRERIVIAEKQSNDLTTTCSKYHKVNNKILKYKYYIQ